VNATASREHPGSAGISAGLACATRGRQERLRFQDALTGLALSRLRPHQVTDERELTREGRSANERITARAASAAPK
jgi:hypothetical protein